MLSVDSRYATTVLLCCHACVYHRCVGIELHHDTGEVVVVHSIMQNWAKRRGGVWAAISAMHVRAVDPEPDLM